MMNIHMIYSAMRDAVKYASTTLSDRCLRPNTFAVIMRPSDLNSPTLGATICDAYKPYFYSREWEATKYNPSTLSYSYPLIAAYENGTGFSSLGGSPSENCYRFSFVFLDKVHEDCKSGKCVGCNGRGVAEVVETAKMMAHNFFSYLFSCRVVRYNGEDFDRLHPEALSDWLLVNGVYSSVDVDTKTTRSYANMMASACKNVQGFPFVGMTSAGLDGIKIDNVELCLSWCADPIEVAYRFDADFSKDLNCCR